MNLIKKLFCLILLIHTSSIFASSFSMGRMETVGTDGAYDVQTNPAKIFINKPNKAFGLMLYYTAVKQEESLYDTKTSTSTGWSHNESKLKSFVETTGSLDYYARTKKNVYGISIRNEYNTSKRETLSQVFTNAIPPATEGTGINSESKGDSQTIYPTLTLAYARKINNHSFFGIRLSGGYQMSTSDSDNIQTDFNNTIQQEAKTTDETNSIIGELALTYTFKKKNSELGLILSSGTIAYEQHKETYEVTGPASVIQWKDSKTIPYYHKLTQGITILAGGKVFISPKFSFAAEGGIESPMVYDEKYIVSTSQQELDTMTTKIDKREGYIMRLGSEVYFLPIISMSLGGGYYYTSSYQLQDSIISMTNFTELQKIHGTIGFSYHTMKGTLFSLASEVTYTTRWNIVSSNSQTSYSKSQTRYNTLQVGIYASGTVAF